MGLCECGCGNPAPLARQSKTKKGWVKGQPVRFIHNHHSKGMRNPMFGRPSAMRGVRGEDSPAWKGGRSVTSGGYVLIGVEADHPFAEMAHKAGGSLYIKEHRLVMATAIGRPLAKREVVHHINGDKGDNRLENLRLFASHSEHMRFHREEIRDALTEAEGLAAGNERLLELLSIIRRAY